MSRGVEHLAVSVTGVAQRTLERLEEADRTSAARDSEIRERRSDEATS